MLIHLFVTVCTADSYEKIWFASIEKKRQSFQHDYVLGEFAR